MALAWTLLSGHNKTSGAVINKLVPGVSYCAVLSGGTGYLALDKVPMILDAVEYIGGTNAGTATEATAGAVTVSTDTGSGAASQTLDLAIAAAATIVSGVRVIRNLFGTYCPTGLGANLASASDSVKVWFRYA